MVEVKVVSLFGRLMVRQHPGSELIVEQQVSTSVLMVG